MTAPTTSQNILQPPQPGMHTDISSMYKFLYEVWVRVGGLTANPSTEGMKASVTELNSLVGINYEDSTQEQIDRKANHEDLGTISAQDADNVTITGGNVSNCNVTVASISNSTLTDVTISDSNITIPVGATTNSAQMGGKLVVDTTSVGNVGVGEDTLITYSMDANTLDLDGSFLEISAWGIVAANANNKEIKLKLGSTVLLTTGAVAANSGNWAITANIIRTAAATQQVIASIVSDNSLIIDSSTFTASTEDLTAALSILCTGEATADDDIIQKGLIVKWFK